ncbi:MAG TPA: hypothetical protein VFJ06_14765 [Halococcus sp.]|nr:hypothetical protein [Halococcus sp.]
MSDGTRPQITTEDQRELARTLGVDETASESPTLSEIQQAIDAETDPEFASMGEAIRSDLSGKLDADLIDEELQNMAAHIERLPAIHEAGIPDGETEAEELYREVIAPAWRVYHHLADVGFFESVEANLPRFTPRHIEHTATELIQTEPLTAALGECGFDEHEQTVLMMNVVNNNIRLSRWVPTREIPEGVEFDVSYVPPLHQRAMGGALLWINALDDHLWTKEILITEQILDDAYWRSKAMLGGLYVMAQAAREIAVSDEAELTDAQVTAALTASAAMLIVNQEEIMKEAFWITEEKRAPSTVR